LRDYLEEDSEDEVAPAPAASSEADDLADLETAAAVELPAAPATPAPAPAEFPIVESIPSSGTPPPPITELPEPPTIAISAPSPAPAPAVNIMKVTSAPEAAVSVESAHAVVAPAPSSVNVTKMEESHDPPKLVIQTEPSVHFTPYDSVFNTNGESEIAYAPKVSVEDKPPSNWGMFDDDEGDEDIPRLTISGGGTGLAGDLDIVDLDAPSAQRAPSPDIDAPLTSTGDFEELA
jgi:hypothetical protein